LIFEKRNTLMKKKCIKCNIDKNIDEFGFAHKMNNKRKNQCKVCVNEYKKNYYQENYEEILEKKKKHYEENRDELLEKNKKYREENTEKEKKRKKKYREKNREELIEKNKKYKKDNPGKVKEYEKRKNQQPKRKMSKTIRSRIRSFFKIKNVTKKNTTFQIVGCTPQELKIHLEQKFVEDMSWENQGEWHIDHIMPLSSAKTEEELYKLCHFTNLQPMWALDNIKKGSKII